MKIRKSLKKAKAGAVKVKQTLDDVLVESMSLKKLRQQIVLQKKKFEKKEELATELALQILDRAKSIRTKLQRKTRRTKKKTRSKG